MFSRINKNSKIFIAGLAAIFLLGNSCSLLAQPPAKTPLSMSKKKGQMAKKSKPSSKKKSKPHSSAKKKKVVQVSAQEAPAFSIRDAMDEALKTHPEIQAFEASKRQAEYRIDQAHGGYFPTVGLRAGAGFEHSKNKFKSSTLNRTPQNGTINTDRYDPSVTVRQTIFDGLDTPHKVEKAEKETTQAGKKIRESRELNAYNAANQYITVRRFQRLYRLGKENVANHKRILGKINAQIMGGKATVADRLHVEARLSDAEAAVSDIEGDLNNAIARYIEFVGKEPGNLSNARVSRSLLPNTLEEALAMAEQKNRSLDLAKASVEVAEADYAVTETPFWPSLRLEGTGARNFNTGGEKGISNRASALLIAEFNVFNGGRDIGKQREYAERVSEAKFRRENELRKAKREVGISWSEMMSARGQAEALRGAVNAKESVKNVFYKQFDLGTRSFLDILDATHEWFLAKGSLITADASEDLSSMRLLASMGNLVDAHGL